MAKSNSQKALIYCRVACSKQNSGEEQGLNLQEKRCREFAELKGYDVISTFLEEGLSGRCFDRPEIQSMLKFMKNQETQKYTALVDDICRLARDIKTYAQLQAAIREVGGTVEVTP